MTREKSEVFYAKIMLFGEYSVICDSMGLAIPYAHFKGELNFINKDKYTDLEFAQASNKQLKSFYDSLKKLSDENKLLADLELDRMEKDLNCSLYFESTIPQGFGIGSSGALCAAIYDRYSRNPVPNEPPYQ